MRERFVSYSKLPKRIFWVVFFAVFLLDQWTKGWIVDHLNFHDVIPVIPGFFQIVRVHNRGAAFGFLRHLPEGVTTPLFLGVGVLALLFLGILLRKVSPKDWQVLVALGGIAGGAVGNMFDRIRYGYVVDFLDFYVGKYHWPAFNIADSAISVGVAYLILRTLLGRDPFRPEDRP